MAGSVFDKCSQFTDAKFVREAGIYPYFRGIDQSEGTRVTIEGREVIMIGSNNYLGLTHDPRVINAAKKAVDKYGVGCTGSRFLNGTLKLHLELEERLARFTGHEAALVFSTGFQANIGTISCLVEKGDIVLSDSDNHASIVDGCRLAKGETVVFEHNNLNDMEKKLQIHADKNKLIVTDSVYSMTGDIAPLDKIQKLAKKYNAQLFVDDAHAFGLLGRSGRGSQEHFSTQFDVIMGTFSKTFSSIGGFVASTHDVIDFIKHKARSMMFSASLPPASTAAVLKVLDIMESENEHIKKLWDNAAYMRKALNEMGYKTSPSETPIIPLHIGEAIQTLVFGMELFNAGLFTNPVLPPAVPQNKGLIRTSYMATHSKKDLDESLAILEKIGRQLRII
ncbi:MAG: pyridoxal phosphate-dependent aminotransferase family protein [Deltaproteobacteria bacterium]|nr:pyridoxal phosphate-dependent aminotransferase family protein [Deltaproteobacteria bacterium]